jgi:hypothetical protein
MILRASIRHPAGDGTDGRNALQRELLHQPFAAWSFLRGEGYAVDPLLPKGDVESHVKPEPLG